MKTTELQTKEQDGELFLEFPDDMMDRLGWKEGDDLSFTDNNDGSFIIKKEKMVNVELEFDNEELLRYMMAAHESGLSFDQWINNVLNTVSYEKLCDQSGTESIT